MGNSLKVCYFKANQETLSLTSEPHEGNFLKCQKHNYILTEAELVFY
jgi:hypothetical protein